MTTAATITANLVLNSKPFQQGMKKAEQATQSFQSKFSRAMQAVKTNAVAIEKVGNALQSAGKKMTTFITLPIIAFFALITKKAMEADTALGKMARDSMARLNEQLLILGEKFLPTVIKLVDFLTNALEKFNNAPPWVQRTVLAFAAFLALAGPLASMTGTILNVVAGISTMGSTITTIIPAIVSLGTAIWGALLPILPILALIAAVIVLIYLLWKNWDQLGVILSQLWFIIKWGFQQMWEGIKSAMSAGLNWLEQETSKSVNVWQENFRQAEEIKQKLFKISVDFMSRTWTAFIGKVNAKISEFRNWAVNAWNYVASIFTNTFSRIANFASQVFAGIIQGINAVISAINQLGFSLESIEIPKELQPGSPTPFEMGLRGISKAMTDLSRKSIPQMKASFLPADGFSDIGGRKTINVTDNRRFASGLDAKALRVALDDQLQGLTRALEAG